MPRLPEVNEYSAAFQHPAACLSDPELRSCTIRTNPLGQPRVRSGGFALTYNLYNGNGSNWAVRCFHRESPDRDRRYKMINSRLHEADVVRSGYFIDFQYQPNGITMPDGSKYPVVRMAWAKGETLGAFLAANYGNPTALKNLRAALSKLSGFLRGSGIAHGDIQPGNIMVSDGGKCLQLIDYDGMFVKGLENLEAAEVGLPNFQHPERKMKAPWNVKLDNFAFIVLDVALEVLADNPSYWNKTQSGDDKVLFSAQDYAAPDSSSIFNELKRDPRYSQKISKLQQVCKDAFESIPDPEDLLEFKYSGVMPRGTTGSTVTIKYENGGVPVVAATNISTLASQANTLVEVVGDVTKVKLGYTKTGRPYAFVGFSRGRWSPRSFELVLWEESLIAVLLKLGAIGDGMTIDSVDVKGALMGVGLSVTGILTERKTSWCRDDGLNVDITNYQIDANDAQISFVDMVEMNFRLGHAREVRQAHVTTATPICEKRIASQGKTIAGSANSEILKRMMAMK